MRNKPSSRKGQPERRCLWGSASPGPTISLTQKKPGLHL